MKDEPVPTASAGSRSRGLAALGVAFVVLWAGYLALRSTMPHDSLTPFRNDLYWPALGSMLEKQPGVVMRVIAHVAATLALGTLLGFVVLGVSRLLRREAPSWVGGASYWLVFVWSFVWFVWPERVTAARPGQLTVTLINPLLPLLTSTSQLPRAELRGLGARLSMGGAKGKVQVVQLVALPRDGASVLLGETECPTVPEACLDVADPAVAQIGRELGWTGEPAISTSPEGTVRVFRWSAE